MTNQQGAPEALRLAGLLELAPEDGIEPQTAEDAAAGLRRLHSENESLQAGYAAARLEIESLHAQLEAIGAGGVEPLRGCAQAAPAAPAGEIVVTKNEQGQIVAVTRQDKEGRVLSIVAESSTPAEGDALDAARLDWLLLHISGAEFRRIGVHYSGNASRADVDAARKQGANHD